MIETDGCMKPLIAGQPIPGDWFRGVIPSNIEAGEGTLVESSHSFHYFKSKQPVGFRSGRGVTIWRTSLAVGEDGVLEVGDYCYLANASLVCLARITIGDRVFVSGGVTIVDSDFHPIQPAARLQDTVLLSPLGDRTKRQAPTACPVVIESDVWVGPNAVVLKGVRIGSGAVVMPGAVVSRNVPAGATVVGNPARIEAADHG